MGRFIITFARTVYGLTQADYALFLGVSGAAVSHWEGGHRRVPRWAVEISTFLWDAARAAPEEPAEFLRLKDVVARGVDSGPAPLVEIFQAGA